jgi:hypothetical protein
MAKLEIPPSDFNAELTRGNVKAAMKSAGAGSADLWTVPPAMLRQIEGFNGRIRTPSYIAHLANIKASIKENGYYLDKPIAGYVAKDPETGEDVIYVTEGHTRHDAVIELSAEGHEVERVTVVVKPNGTTMEDLKFALIQSNDGRPFTTFEIAVQVKCLVGMGVDEATIARRLNFKSGKVYVDDLLILAGAPKAIRDLVIDDKISATLAIQELKKNGAKASDRLKAAVEKATSAGKKKATAKHVEKAPKKTKAKAAPVEEVPHVETDRMIEIAEACGFAMTMVDLREKLMTFTATILEEVGAELYLTPPHPHGDDDSEESDPAADL